MARLTLALAVWMSLASAGSASVPPRKDPPVFDKDARRAVDPPLPARTLGQSERRNSLSDFVVTDQTEVLLDGKPCRYEAVAGDVVIVRITVAADKKTVLSIHFRTRK
jgi:hypothetical protein